MDFIKENYKKIIAGLIMFVAASLGFSQCNVTEDQIPDLPIGVSTDVPVEG